jgi:hypothetical protein
MSGDRDSMTLGSSHSGVAMPNPCNAEDCRRTQRCDLRLLERIGNSTYLANHSTQTRTAPNADRSTRRPGERPKFHGYWIVSVLLVAFIIPFRARVDPLPPG